MEGNSGLRTGAIHARERTDRSKRTGSGIKIPVFSRSRLILLLGNLAALLPLLVFNGTRWSVDSPSILVDGQWTHLGAFLDSYRYFGALIARLYSLTGHDPIGNCLPDTILFILLAGIGTTLLVAGVADHLKIDRPLSVLALDLAALLSLENAWFCEILTFPESIFLSGIGYLLCCLAILFFVRHRSLRGLAASAVCLILSTAVYQQYIVVFTIFTVSVLGCEILAEETPTAGSAFRKYAGAAAFILGCGAVYLLAGMLIAKAFGIGGGSRVATQLNDILDNIRFYLLRQHSFLKGRGYFRTEIMTATVLLCAAAWLALFLRRVRETKRRGAAAVVLLAFAMAYASGYLTGIISKSHDTRVVFGLFSVFFLFVCGVVSLGRNKWIPISVSCVLAVFLAANIFAVVKTADYQKEQNRIDAENAGRIMQAIEDYENAEGVTVRNLYYCYDQKKEETRFYSMFYYDYSIGPFLIMNSRGYPPKEGEPGLKVSEMPEQIRSRYFADKDWTALDPDEQLVFVGDCAYLCVF